MKQKIIVGIFFFLESVCSFLAWKSVYAAVLIPGSSHFLVPGIFFSLLAALLLLSVILFSIAFFRVVTIGIAVLPALFFGGSMMVGVTVICAGVLMYRSLHVIDRELSEHLTIRFFSSTRVGTFMLALGFSLVIVASYMMMISTLSPEKLFPRFSLADGSGRIALQMAGKVNPALASLAEDDLSVDEFLLGLMPSETAGGTGQTDSKNAELRSAPNANGIDYNRLMEVSGDAKTEFQKTLFLTEGRRRISDVLGRDVRGDERAAEIFSEIINAKIFGSFSAVHTEGKSLDTLRAVIALLLFLSLLSLGPIFGLIWASLAALAFWILRGSNIVAIRLVSVEAEQIVLVD